MRGDDPGLDGGVVERAAVGPGGPAGGVAVRGPAGVGALRPPTLAGPACARPSAVAPPYATRARRGTATRKSVAVCPLLPGRVTESGPNRNTCPAGWHGRGGRTVRRRPGAGRGPAAGVLWRSSRRGGVR